MEELLSNLSHLMNYRKQVPEEGFSELMGKILAQWPGAGWELGPDPAAPDIDRLSLSVSGVPALQSDPSLAAQLPLRGDGWVIGLGIPPRDWEMYFEATLAGRELEVEGSQWQWNMADAGAQVVLTVAPPERFGTLDDESLRELAGVIVGGELGESNVAAHVQSIGVARRAGGAQQWLPMARLRSSFVDRFPDCEYAAWLAASR